VAAEPKRWRRLSWSSLSASVISWGWLLYLLFSRLAPIVYTSIDTHTHTHQQTLSPPGSIEREQQQQQLLMAWRHTATRYRGLFFLLFWEQGENIHSPLLSLFSLWALLTIINEASSYYLLLLPDSLVSAMTILPYFSTRWLCCWATTCVFRRRRRSTAHNCFV
jgi:hypothetical protein